MPWKEREIMSLREEFISKALSKIESVSKLCREYQISRCTAYKWLQRYDQEGIVGLRDRSRKPFYSPFRICHESIDLITSMRDKYPAWGAKKLRQVLMDKGHKNLPSLSSFNRILKSQDKITEETARKRFIRFERENPNELWQMDFKGHFALPEGNCYPLTILDDCSRYSICLKACASESEAAVRNGLEESFRQYGLPVAMTMDNGSPWKGYPGQRLSSLTVWLMRLGIKVTHSRPNHPQTQGKDERFHRTFKAEVLRYHNFQSLSHAQELFDQWRKVYNQIRPHEALEMKRPADKYRVSERPYIEKLPPIEYLAEDVVKKVEKNGEIFFQKKSFYIGTYLKGEPIALRQRGEDEWDIYYVNSRLATFKPKV